MTTPAHLAQARLEQATADRETAEQVLAQALHVAGVRLPRGAALAEAIHWRCVEALVEDPRTAHAQVAQAYSAYRRAQRAESKARSAAHRAELTATAPPPAKPAPRRKRKPTQQQTTFAAHLVEARAA